MKTIKSTGLILLASANLCAADWDEFPIPATPTDGYEWQLLSLSDDFNYSAPANGKSDEFYSRWQEGFINQWTGPGLTEWNPEYSKVKDGYLQITIGKNPNNSNIYAGSIVSKESLTYPIYMEVRAKISDMVTASNFWLLSKDSTQEIDVLEAYGSTREDQTWFAERIHLSHHVFIREPFQDYQPLTEDTWYRRNDGVKWKGDFHTIGVYWRDPWHLEYYIDGKFIKSSSGKDIIDPLDYTEGTGLSKPMQAIINTESHTWRSDDGIIPTDDEINDPVKNLYLVDWVRFYQAVPKNQATDPTAWHDGEVISKEFSDFIETGNEGGNSPSDTVNGFGVAGTNINYNTAGDWATYTLDIPDAGFYRIELVIGSPESGIGAEIQINNELFSTVKFSATGDWEIYQTFTVDKPLKIDTSGSYSIRIKSQGSSDWQWNGDKINLVQITPIGENDSASVEDIDTSGNQQDTQDDQQENSTNEDATFDTNSNSPPNNAEQKNEASQSMNDSDKSSGSSIGFWGLFSLAGLIFSRRK